QHFVVAGPARGIDQVSARSQNWMINDRECPPGPEIVADIKRCACRMYEQLVGWQRGRRPFPVFVNFNGDRLPGDLHPDEMALQHERTDIATAIMPDLEMQAAPAFFSRAALDDKIGLVPRIDRAIAF